jgi:wyosine [tRNA(Phe)-imidazoG37] synthetase (radical SAM superfamily)
VPLDAVLAEVREVLDSDVPVDVVTFSGSGEPTLSLDLGSAIRAVKDLSGPPVAVLTNGTLLWMSEVRRELSAADIVCPSLDSAVEETARKINRFHQALKFDTMMEGLARFSNEFKGKYWLEVLLAAGINDTEEEIQALSEAIGKINPDEVHLNTIVRPPAEESAKPLNRKELEAIASRIPGTVKIIGEYAGTTAKKTSSREDRKRIISMLNRRPMTTAEIADMVGLSHDYAQKTLILLAQSGLIRSQTTDGKEYWLPAETNVG